MARTKSTQKLRPSMKLTIALILTFALLLSWSILLVRDKLLSNANEMGTLLAESYAAEEEGRFASYETYLGVGARYVNGEINNEGSVQTIEQWLQSYAVYLTEVLGTKVIDPYAVINGDLIATDPWEGDATYDYSSTDWYQGALNAEGHAYFTDVYQDAITGDKLVTLSMRLNGEGNVLAFNIRLNDLYAFSNEASMPEDSSYYLLDRNGQFVYVNSRMNPDLPEAQAYMAGLVERIEDGSLEDPDAYITDVEGVERGVYYTVMDNGWLSIVTIPLENILQDGWDATILALAAFSLLLVVAVIVVALREHLRNRKIERTAETLRALGDTFYAIYRIDLKEGTYETVKSSEDVRSTLGDHGSYQHLIDTMSEVVEAKTYAVFEDSFSLENICRLADEGASEFGGDYQRRFGDAFKWVSIKVTFSDGLGHDEVIMSFREIDEEKRRQMQQQALLENALNSAKQTAKRKNDFFSKVSHDLRTPLNAIIGLSDLALKEPDNPDKAFRNLERIGQSGRQMLTLVNDVLDMSRIEQGEGSMLDVAPMDLEKCLQDSAALFEAQAQQEDKHIEVDLDVENPCVIGDAFRLGQVFNNLISNAVKYTLPGGTIRILLREVSVGTKLNKYQVTVSDTGIGMSESFLEHIFEPFARETAFSTRRVVGTGLGMPIVKSLVQQMSGEIAVESTPGVGSTFIVTLPLQPAEPEQPADDNPATPELPDLTGMTVLVAEDNEINMEIAREYLDMMGADSIPAWNGREAVDLFASLEMGSVDVILMDMQMPEMDGCEACEAIRALDREDARTVPIIAVTANAFAEDITRTTAAGMNGHISKPIDFGALGETLRDALAGRL